MYGFRKHTDQEQNKCPDAEIVHDRFHIMKYMNEAVDAVRKREHKTFMKTRTILVKYFLKNKRFTKNSDFGSKPEPIAVGELIE